MNVARCLLRPAGFIGLMTLMMAGCASVEPLLPKVENISPKRRQRSQAASLQFDRQRASAEFEVARDLWDQGDFDGSSGVLRRLLARTPDHLEARLLIAESLLAANRPSEAVPYLEPAMAADPDDPRVHHMMGLLLDAMGQTDDALIHYEQAARLQPDNEVYAVCYQTMLASDAESPESSEGSGPPPPPMPGPAAIDAHAGAEAPARFIPEGGRVGRAGPRGLGEAAASSDGRAAASASELLQKGLSAMSNGLGALALAYFQEAAALNPHDPQIPIAAAISAVQHNQPDVAVSLLRPLPASGADSAAVRRILGLAYYRLGDYESSQVALQQALSLDKSHALSYFLMGCTLVKLGQPAAAETHFRQARTLDPRYAVGR